MPLTPQPYIEHPNLRVSMAMVVDDPAPCINPLWYFRNQVDGQDNPPHERFIPLAFMEKWCRWVGESGVRGDFTILPYPAGLGRVDREMSAQALADRYVTEDGLQGRLSQLLAGGGPIVIVTHWQSLYSNGTHLGLKTFQEVGSRVASVYKDRIAWRKLSEIAAQHLAASTVRFEAQAGQSALEIVAKSAFSADILTVSIPTPWPLYKAPRVFLDGLELQEASDAAHLECRRWIMRGSVITVSLPIAAGQPSRIAIRTANEGEERD